MTKTTETKRGLVLGERYMLRTPTLYWVGRVVDVDADWVYIDDYAIVLEIGSNGTTSASDRVDYPGTAQILFAMVICAAPEINDDGPYATMSINVKKGKK